MRHDVRVSVMSGRCPSLDAPPADRARRAGLRLECATIAWNVIEGVVAIAAGWLAGSVALIGFGVDSAIECMSGGAMVWRLSGQARDHARDRLALRWVGVSFLLLSAYVGVDACMALWRREQPEASPAGMVMAALSLVVMPILARAKRAVAARLDSGALRADARQTDLCAYLSAILLGGLALNASLGWWWADPVAAIVMVPIIAREGLSALRGQACSC
jgi:divalent metal cation (Fe/Co/Zn/Cd) transporter